MRQQTNRKSVTLEGVGLHSGKPARVTLSPAPEDTGIVFRVGGDHIAAAPESVVNSHWATTIGKNGARVQTVEREMAPRFHALLEEVGRRTGIPVLLNTSFNLAGEPIVSRAVEAYSTFRRSGIDLLVCGRDLVAKRREEAVAPEEAVA